MEVISVFVGDKVPTRDAILDSLIAHDQALRQIFWRDTTTAILRRCTSISPVTFISTEGGGCPTAHGH